MEKKHSSPIFGQIPGSKPIRAIRVGLGTCGEVSMESVTPGVHPPWRKSTVHPSSGEFPARSQFGPFGWDNGLAVR